MQSARVKASGRYRPFRHSCKLSCMFVGIAYFVSLHGKIVLFPIPNDFTWEEILLGVSGYRKVSGIGLATPICRMPVSMLKDSGIRH